MKDTLKKAFLFGVGAMAITGEKIEEFVNEMISKGEVTSEEGKKMIDEWKQKIKTTQQELGERIKDEVSKAISKFDLATKKDIEEIKTKLNEIEQKLNNNMQ